MSIRRLTVTGVRNLADTRFEPGPGVNVVYGDNGAGKSSLLEAIHLLALARSFKVSRTRTLIQNSVDEATVFAEFTNKSKVGVQRSRSGHHSIRINGEAVSAVSELAQRLPLQLIHSDSFLLLEGTPGHRRQFLDWGVFHLEEAFHSLWQNAQKSLKNRNSVLRSGRMDRSQLAVWQREFVAAAEQLDQLRKGYLEGFVPRFHKVLEALIDLPDVRIHYYRGWDKTRSLDEVLEQQFERDLKLGYTQSGPQRSDMRIKVNSQSASDMLSRGQQKLVVCALKVAQSLHLQDVHNRPTTFLVDDLPAELDRHHIQKLGTLMEGLNGQVFMTSVEPSFLKDFWQAPDQVRMFHVEQGQIRPANDSELPDE